MGTPKKHDANWWREECNYISRVMDRGGRVKEMNSSPATFRRYCEMQRDAAERDGVFDAATYIQEVIDDLPAPRSENPLAKRVELIWNAFAGGTGAFNPSHNSYSARNALGTVHVDPPTRRGGMWSVRFSNDLGRVSGGLWRDLGKAKTAAQGKKLAADFLENLSSESASYSSLVKQNPLTRVKVMSPPQRPAGTRAKPSPDLVKRRRKTAKAPEGFYANPLTVAEKAVNQRSLVGSVQYAVLFYSGKDKPSGKPDFVIPARDKKHAHAFVEQLRDKGASGVAVVEKTTNRV